MNPNLADAICAVDLLTLRTAPQRGGHSSDNDRIAR